MWKETTSKSYRSKTKKNELVRDLIHIHNKIIINDMISRTNSSFFQQFEFLWIQELDVPLNNIKKFLFRMKSIYLRLSTKWAKLRPFLLIFTMNVGGVITRSKNKTSPFGRKFFSDQFTIVSSFDFLLRNPEPATNGMKSLMQD